MNLSRRSFGLGKLAVSAAATGGYLALKDTPLFSAGAALTGFVGGEKKGFLANPKTISALRSLGFTLTARQVGSVEMVREKALLQQNPQFLWPSSSVMVQIARDNGVAVRKQEVVLNSPLVIYAWENVADALVKSGLVKPGPDNTRLIGAMMSKDLQEIAWRDHGFRGILGAPDAALDASLPHVPEKLDAIVPMPDSGVMLKLLQMLAA